MAQFVFDERLPIAAARLRKVFYGTTADDDGPAARLEAHVLGGARLMGVVTSASLVLVHAPILLIGTAGWASSLQIVLGSAVLAAAAIAASWLLPRSISGTALATAVTLVGLGSVYVGAANAPSDALPHPELLACFAPLVVMSLVVFAPVRGRVVLAIALVAVAGHVLAWRAGVLGGDRATHAVALGSWVEVGLAAAWLARVRRRSLGALFARELELARQNQHLQDAHAQLLRSERFAVLGRLAGTVSHELGNPLTAMHCCLDELRAAIENARESHDDAPLEDALESLDVARLAVDRSTRYLQALREQTRGLASVEEREVDLAHELRSLVLLMSRAAARAGVSVEVDAPEVLRVRTDPGKLVQVVANLIENAIDAARGVAGALPIRVAARREEDWLVIEVRDDGRGIERAVRGRLFEPLITTKQPSVGTGLGLAICQDTVRQLGGTIDAHELDPRGAAFVVRIPLPDA